MTMTTKTDPMTILPGRAAASVRLYRIEREALATILDAGREAGRTLNASAAIRGAIRVAAGYADETARVAPVVPSGVPKGAGARAEGGRNG